MVTINYILRVAVLVLAAVSFAPSRCMSADGLTIYVPESLTDVTAGSARLAGERRNLAMSVLSTTGKKAAIVGMVDDPSGVRIEVSNNNRPPVTPAMHKNYFHAGIVLSLGNNQVDVRWRKGEGPWRTKSLVIFRSSKLDGGVSSSYPPYLFHIPDNEKNCESCHHMSLTKAEIESGMEKSCLVCHTGLTDNVYVHGPVAVGICTVCHDPESSPNKYVVNDTDEVLCYGCHTDRKEIDEKKALLHGPVGAGLCTVCHDPHASPFEFQLVKARTEICIICHQEDYDRWSNEEFLHPPFKKGDCAACHDPHSSDVLYNLKASRADICGLCHEVPVPGHLHPVGVKPQFKVPEGFTLDEGGLTICLTCHDPHGAKGPRMTRGIGCDGCHPK